MVPVPGNVPRKTPPHKADNNDDDKPRPSIRPQGGPPRPATHTHARAGNSNEPLGAPLVLTIASIINNLKKIHARAPDFLRPANPKVISMHPPSIPLLPCTVLYFALLYFGLFQSTTLCSFALRCFMVLYCILLHCASLYFTLHKSTHGRNTIPRARKGRRHTSQGMPHTYPQTKYPDSALGSARAPGLAWDTYYYF